MPHRGVTRLAIAACGLVLAGGGGCAWIVRDAPATPDPRLATHRAEVADADNGLVRLRAAARDMLWSAEDYKALAKLRDAGGWDSSLARRITEPNEAVLDALHEAIRAPAFRDEVRRSFDDSYGEHGLPIVQAAKIASIRARERALAGDEDGCIADALAVVRLGQRYAESPAEGLVQAMVSIAIQRTGLEALSLSLPELRPSATASVTLQRELEALRIDPDRWAALWADAYRDFREIIARSATEPTETDASFRERLLAWILPPDYLPNRTAALYADFVLGMRDAGRGPCSQLELLAIETEGWRTLLLPVLPNRTGEILVRIAVPNFRTFEMRRCLAATQFDATQALLALRAFEVERGELPATLDALVPRYLDRVPVDHFDGGTLHYAPDRRLLHSVGADFREGAPFGGDPSLAEPTFPIPSGADRGMAMPADRGATAE